MTVRPPGPDPGGRTVQADEKGEQAKCRNWCCS
ncbi:hypothetical protein Ae168Ps1_3529c [Pseudonocardia sp. Ae168_Ps1]|nr:hypothetical protein Ae150APs1_3506c [Pseudonocardia sp. Ae150A_Ps1]OLL81123.1 hypothetical protein Ae168Ps1_3529c [Pseudonocardia sp. Ae168_Ps1]OLL84763.1 hypothetical protein Ae263Ps1_1818 [Pseudonocardia sp. Ae263_Ps1]OLL95220.1 hypothetical protein Ae356Ps1_5117c [Pseudonocardia sp. Ae356_Ps1]